jgi:hypothetical protein
MTPALPIASGIARYGLQSNPYTPRALDPLTREEQLHKVIWGVHALAEAENYVERAVELEEAAFVLVSGRSGTGRTSVANHLLRHYRDKREIADTTRFIVPRSRYSGQDPFDIFKKWVTSLYAKLTAGGLTPLGAEGFDLDQELATRQNLQEDTYATHLSVLLSQLAAVLQVKEAAFGVCFENVKDYRLVDASFEAFGETQTLVVLTVLDYPRTDDSIRVLFERHVPETGLGSRGYPVVELEPIRGRSAKELVQHRWSCAQPDVESPFDGTGLEQAFDDRLRTAGRVLQLTEHVLNWHAATVGEGPLWPDAREQLAFECDLLRRLMPEVDRSLPERDNV